MKESPIQAYCTFIDRCTPTGDGGLYCDKCRTKINDLTDMSPEAIDQLRASNPAACGFVRTVGTAAALASTLALASCSDPVSQAPLLNGDKAISLNVTGGIICPPSQRSDAGKPKADEGKSFPVVPGQIAGPDRKAESYPVAKPVSGKPGVVISPYTGKEVDVRGIKSGNLVMDPAFPVKEQKLFRLP